MANFYKITFAFLLCVFATSTITSGQDDVASKIHRNYKPEVGKPHPDFILPSIEDGKQLQLSDYRGKKVLLLHFASW